MIRQYLALPRAVHILCLGTFINRAGNFLIPFLTLYLGNQLHFSERFATRTMGLYGLGAIVAALVGGHLADWIGRRTVMLLSLFGGAATLTAFANLTTPWLIMTAVVFFGLIAEMYRPAASAMIGDLVEPHNRPHAFGLMYVSINLGFAVGPAIGGFIAQRMFKVLFYCDAATSTAYGLIILFALRETLASRQTSDVATGSMPHEANVPFGEAVRTILRDRPFQVFCLAGLLLGITFMQCMSTFPLYLKTRGIAESSYGWLISLNGVLIVALQLPATEILARFERGLVLVTAAIVIGVGFALTAAATTVWQFAGTILVWTLGEIIQAAYVFAVVADLAPAKMRGRYMGVFGMSYALAMTIGVPLGGEVLARLGGGWLWGGCLGCGLLSAALYLSIREHMRPKAVAAQQH